MAVQPGALTGAKAGNYKLPAEKIRAFTINEVPTPSLSPTPTDTLDPTETPTASTTPAGITGPAPAGTVLQIPESNTEVVVIDSEGDDQTVEYIIDRFHDKDKEKNENVSKRDFLYQRKNKIRQCQVATVVYIKI